MTSLERLHELGHDIVLTDRHAAYAYAEYRAFDPADPINDGFVDWALMRQEYWNNTLDEPQRMERRMAEALVHERVAWDAITKIGAKSDVVAAEVRATLNAALLRIPVNVVGRWYF